MHADDDGMGPLSAAKRAALAFVRVFFSAAAEAEAEASGAEEGALIESLEELKDGRVLRAIAMRWGREDEQADERQDAEKQEGDMAFACESEEEVLVRVGELYHRVVCCGSAESRQEAVARILGMEEDGVQQEIMREVEARMLAEQHAGRVEEDRMELQREEEESEESIGRDDEEHGAAEEEDEDHGVDNVDEEDEEEEEDNERRRRRKRRSSADSACVVRSLTEQVNELQRNQEGLQRRAEVSEAKCEELMREQKDSALRAEIENMETLDKLMSCQSDLASVRERLSEAERTAAHVEQQQHEITRLRDEIDVLKPQAEESAALLDQIEKYRERLGEMSTLRTQLTQEQEAHSALLDRNLELEEQNQQIGRLNEQVANYKTVATESQVQLREAQAELESLREHLRELRSSNAEWQASVQEHSALAAGLQQNLLSTAQSATIADDETGVGALGKGMSELNPELQEELQRLRKSNAHLQETMDYATLDKVRDLEEKLDDKHRLMSSYESKYLATKDELAVCSDKLTKALARIEDLEAQLAEQTEKRESAESQLAETAAALATCQAELCDAREEIDSQSKRIAEHEAEEIRLTESANQRLKDAEERRETLLNYFQQQKALHLAKWKDYVDSHSVSNTEHEEQIAEQQRAREQAETRANSLAQELDSARRQKRKLDKERKTNRAEIDRLRIRLARNSAGGAGSSGSTASNALVQKTMAEFKQLHDDAKALRLENESLRAQLSATAGRAIGGGRAVRSGSTVNRGRNDGDSAARVATGSGDAGVTDYTAMAGQYEQRFHRLKEEQRELFLKHNASVSKCQQVEGDNAQMQEQLRELQQQNTRLRLQLERSQRVSTTAADGHSAGAAKAVQQQQAAARVPLSELGDNNDP